MLRNGSESKTGQHPKVGKAKGKARAKGRKVATVIEMPNLCATIGARGMGTAATPPPGTSLTTVLSRFGLGSSCRAGSSRLGLGSSRLESVWAWLEPLGLGSSRLESAWAWLEPA